LSFTPELDSTWFLYRHVDRPPGKFKSLATWGIDRESGRLVSILLDNFGAARLFSSDGWKDGAVTFESTGFLNHKTAPERFRYERQSPDSFKMTYEVGKPDGTWRLGDYIVCTRNG